MKPPALESILVEAIEAHGDRRVVQPDKVAALVASIEMLGLKTPISVRYYSDRPEWAKPGDTDDALVLIAGAHRLAAAKQLGWTKIECLVHYEGDEIDAGLWEIDENLCRSELSEAEEARCLAKRKELWEAREKREAEIRVAEVKPPEFGYAKPPPAKKGFATETAGVTGQAKSTVNAKIARATAIAPDVLDAITGGKWDKGVVLDILKKLTHAEQRQALFRVQHGSSHSFEDAYDFIKGEPPAAKQKPPKVIDIPEPKDWSQVEDEQKRRLMQVWNACAPAVQRWFRETVVDRPVMDADDGMRIPAFMVRSR